MVVKNIVYYTEGALFFHIYIVIGGVCSSTIELMQKV